MKYLDNDYNIDKLQMTTVLLGDLEKVGWVVLKCDFKIPSRSGMKIFCAS